ncbi:MAG: DUF6252 family protein [Segetibacter sp.]
MGAGTFGCPMNGIAFTPKRLAFWRACIKLCLPIYKWGYYFQLHAKRNESSNTMNIVNSISIGTDSSIIEQGKIYKSSTPKKGGIAGKYSTISSTIINYQTSDLLQGELKITKFDETNRIVSGTFWFDGVNTNGEKVQVQEGRFDMHYTL